VWKGDGTFVKDITTSEDIRISVVPLESDDTLSIADKVTHFLIFTHNKEP
jgi:hypothetical protein